MAKIDIAIYILLLIMIIIGFFKGFQTNPLSCQLVSLINRGNSICKTFLWTNG